MFHGLLTKNKNIDVLLQTARSLPKMTFWIVGDGPDKTRLKNIAPRNVIFWGWRAFKDMHYFINECDLGIALRSDNPGNEYVVTSPFLQYGAMKKPCLVTRRKVFGDYKWQFSDKWELHDHIMMLFYKQTPL